MLSFFTSGLGSILTGMLGSAQFASLGRTIAKSIGVALLVKYAPGFDAAHSLEILSGAGALLLGMASSAKSHIGTQSIPDALKDAASTAAQAAVAAAVPAIVQQISPFTGLAAALNPTQPQA